MPRKRKDGKDDLSEKKISLSLTISCSRIDVEVNPVVYSEDDIGRITEIVEAMSQHIYIDKTYVAYKGTRWRDAFIVEKTWHRFCKLIVDTHFGNDAGEKINDYILNCLEMLAETYLYQILARYGYDPEFIELSFPEGSDIMSDYEIDRRTSWDS